MAKYGKKAGKKVERAMRERKRGTLKSGRSGRRVTSRKQAIAIGLSEARRSGAKVPKRKGRAKADARHQRSDKLTSIVALVAPYGTWTSQHFSRRPLLNKDSAWVSSPLTATMSTGSRGVRKKAGATCLSDGAPMALSPI
jgi:hypothetical protein